MIKSLVLAAVTGAGALGATSADAGVAWSVNVNRPVIGTVVSGGPSYYGRANYGPAHYGPAYYGPGYDAQRHVGAYRPVPVYRVAPPVAYYPAPAYYRPVPVGYPRYYPGWRHGHGRWEGNGRR